MAMAHYTAFFSDAVRLLAKEKSTSIEMVLSGLASHTGVSQDFLNKCFIGENQLVFSKLKRVISFRIDLLKKKTKSYEVRKADVSDAFIGKELAGKETFSLYDFLYRNTRESSQQLVDLVTDAPGSLSEMRGFPTFEVPEVKEPRVIFSRKMANCTIPLLVVGENYSALNLNLLYWIASPEKFFDLVNGLITSWAFTPIKKNPSNSADFIVEDGSRGVNPDLVPTVELVFDTFENALGAKFETDQRGEVITWKEDTCIAIFTFPENSSLPSIDLNDFNSLCCVIKRIIEIA